MRNTFDFLVYMKPQHQQVKEESTINDLKGPGCELTETAKQEETLNLKIMKDEEKQLEFIIWVFNLII